MGGTINGIAPRWAQTAKQEIVEIEDKGEKGALKALTEHFLYLSAVRIGMGNVKNL